MLIEFFVVLFFVQSVYTDCKPPRFQVSLDASAEERWVEVADAYKKDVPWMVNLSRTFVPKILQPAAFYLATKLEGLLSTDLVSEMKGIAKHSGLPVGEIIWLNLLYDFIAFSRNQPKACTSIVAEDSSGSIWHGRNLDFVFQDFLTNITILVDFVKDNKILFSGVTFAFHVGLMTGQKHGVFAVSIDERYSGPWWYNLLMAILTKMKHPLSFAVREALQLQPTFNSAANWLSTIPLISPSYIILSGTRKGEGVVISRDRERSADDWLLEPYKGVWYLVETNFDHWKPDVDGRRTAAEAQLNSTGQTHISAETMYTILSTKPVMNNFTIYSVVMSAANPNILYDYAFIRRNMTCRL